MMSLHWLSLTGDVPFSEQKHIYTPEKAFLPKPLPGTATENATAFEPYAMIRANHAFAGGEIGLDFMLAVPDARLQFVLTDEAGMPLYCGINALDALYGIAVYDDDRPPDSGKWKLLAGAGYRSSISMDAWHTLVLRVHGARLVLLVDEVEVASVQHSLKKGPLSLYFQGKGKIEVRDIRARFIEPECFVVMQFSDEFSTLYQEVIEPTCRQYGYRVRCGDDFYHSGMVIDDINQSIRGAALIIADVTPDNANVFYEVGLAHGIGKPTILLCDRQRERLPFDIAGFRTLFYSNTIGGKRALEEGLKKHLAAIGSTRFQTPPAQGGA